MRLAKEIRTNQVKIPIYGMPILLKDNINFEGLPTTAELNF
jgi:Asp-tRNA(Asn)/Glu-tRNA(Gln) amidotransferase A subunit family amidase